MASRKKKNFSALLRKGHFEFSLIQQSLFYAYTVKATVTEL